MAVSDKVAKRVMAQYDKTEKPVVLKIEKVVLKYLLEQSEKLLKHVNSFNDTKSNKRSEESLNGAKKLLKTYDFEEDANKLYKTLFPLLVMSGEVGNDLANIVLYAEEESYQLFSVIEPRYLKWLKAYGTDQSKFITETTKTKATNIIADGIENGLSYSAIGEELSNRLNGISQGRATNIAATEVHTTFMSARNFNAEVGGFKEKAWLSSRDKAVRPKHQVYDSLGWVDFDYLFGGRMKYPGDPNGTPDDVIRCRCDIMYK